MLHWNTRRPDRETARDRGGADRLTSTLLDQSAKTVTRLRDSTLVPLKLNASRCEQFRHRPLCFGPALPKSADFTDSPTESRWHQAKPRPFELVNIIHANENMKSLPTT